MKLYKFSSWLSLALLVVLIVHTFLTVGPAVSMLFVAIGITTYIGSVLFIKKYFNR
jgi:hypothetical protein